MKATCKPHDDVITLHGRSSIEGEIDGAHARWFVQRSRGRRDRRTRNRGSQLINSQGAKMRIWLLAIFHKLNALVTKIPHPNPFLSLFTNQRGVVNRVLIFKDFAQDRFFASKFLGRRNIGQSEIRGGMRIYLADLNRIRREDWN